MCARDKRENFLIMFGFNHFILKKRVFSQYSCVFFSKQKYVFTIITAIGIYTLDKFRLSRQGKHIVVQICILTGLR